MRETAQDPHRDGKRTARASDRRLGCHVPPDVRSRAVDEPRRVRRREPPLAAPQRRDLQPRRRRGGHPQRPVARRGLCDPRLLPRLSVAASVQRARLGARRAGQSDERRHLHDSGRVHLLAAAPGIALPNERPLRDGEQRAGRRDHDRRGSDAARFGAGRDGRPAARPRSRLPRRLRPRTNRVHAPRHACSSRSGTSTSATRRTFHSVPRRRRSPDFSRSSPFHTARSISSRSTSHRARRSIAPTSGCREAPRSRPA